LSRRARLDLIRRAPASSAAKREETMLYYGYFRSSASFRVRIAFGLKGLAPDFKSIHLRKGDQFADAYKKYNPQEQVPTVVTDVGDVLVQSPAILEWLE
jgi:glutathione S-transferase